MQQPFPIDARRFNTEQYIEIGSITIEHRHIAHIIQLSIGYFF